MPVVLDTDHLSVVQWCEEPAYNRLRARLRQLSPDDVATTILSFHEQMQGWLAYLNRARKPEQIVLAYTKLEEMWRSFLKMNVLSFGQEAQRRFTELRRHCPRLQTMDLRIASVALVSHSILLTRNLRDFHQVPGLDVEDWTA